MKTPEEIKKGLAVHKSETADCSECPYENVETQEEWERCFSNLEADVLAYILQLEKMLGESFARNAPALEAAYGLAEKVRKLEAKVPKWISVKDKMPPTGNAVLVVVHNAKMAWTCVEVDVWDGRWLENADSEWHIVTHWMPLPEPPEV